jgi:hypothetical protein
MVVAGMLCRLTQHTYTCSVELRWNLLSFAGFPMSKTQYMVVEHFKNKDAVPVYWRFRDRGRLAPEGLVYVSSWVDDRLERCYQLMETNDRKLLDECMAKVEGFS